MKITIKLMGKREGKDDVPYFTTSTNSRARNAQQTVWEYFTEHCTVKGLGYNLSGSGLILVSADNDQLDRKTVKKIQEAAQAALAILHV